jgi:hypothetical protein
MDFWAVDKKRCEEEKELMLKMERRHISVKLTVINMKLKHPSLQREGMAELNMLIETLVKGKKYE